jgi:hypothetical protein
MSAGDYWLIRSENAQNRSPETGGQFAKGAIGGPFCEYQGQFLQALYCLADLGGFELAHSQSSNAL